MLILNTQDISKVNATSEEIGGKAAGLHKLTNLGFNVPDWFCIHTDLFEQVKKSNIELNFNTTNLNQFKALLNEADCSSKLEKMLLEIENSKECLFAVRSSANLEDSSDKSFAGLFESYLNISSKDIETNIFKAFCDVYDEKIATYCDINSIDLSAIKFSVVIQKMINPLFAGVCFTENPMNIKELIISSVPGLGDKLVDGTSVANNYSYIDNKLISKTIEFGEIDDINVITKLSTICSEIEMMWKCPVDIEWAYDGEIYILQTRPITTTNDKVFIIDNSNIVESFPGVTLPLTYSFAQKVYSTVFMDALESLSLRNENIEHVTNNLIHYYQGRIFYNLTSWYEMMLTFPMAHYYIPTWEESLGIKNGLKLDINTDNTLIKIWKTLKTVVRFTYTLLTIKNKSSRLERETVKKLERARRLSLSDHETEQFFSKVIKDFSIGWDVTLVNDLYVFIFSGLAKFILALESSKHESLFNKYIMQDHSLESIKPLESMINIACYLDGNIASYEEMSLDELMNKSITFKNLFLEHLDKYGDRSLEDLKLESVTFRQNPNLLYTYIKSMKGMSLDAIQHGELTDSIIFRSPLRELLFNFALKKAKESIEIRESFRLYRSRFYGVARSFYIKHGKELEAKTIIDSYLDIFYLSIEELENGHTAFKEIIKTRKEEYSKYRKQGGTIPRYMVNNDRYDPISVNVDHSLKSYTGTACSQGIIKAEVIVIKNLEEARDNPAISKGKILVSPMTDPGWIYLMKNSVGLIVEKGSILSHSAIIGRELGLPTVVNIPVITEALKTGQIVTLDGYNGVITIHD